MSKYYHILQTEIREHYKWILAWLLGIHAYTLLAVLIYPGEEALQGFLGLLDDPYFAAVLGHIGGQDPSYAMWIGLLIPFSVLGIFMFSVMLGVRLSSKSISDETGEIVHSVQSHRYTFLTVRALVGVVAIVINFLLLVIMLRIPLLGEVIDLDVLWNISWWGILFSICALSLGMILGLVSQDSAKGNQYALFLSVTLYGLQLIGRLADGMETLNDFNPITWYRPEEIIWGGTIPEQLILRIIAGLIGFLTLSYWLFSSRDLIINAPIEVPVLSSIHLPKIRREDPRKELVKVKSDRDSIFTRWARPLERRFPLAADFIYSERTVVLIMFWVVIIAYPGQLMVYNPDDPEFIKGLEETIDSFGSAGVMEFFTYGHDLGDNLFLWLLVTQAIGLHYFFFVPLTAHWIKKILLADTDTNSGELMASIPIKEHRVLLQRLMAVLLEMLLFAGMMIFWLLISEAAVETSVNQTWEIAAILSVIPLYIFLVTAGLSLGLMKKDGVKYARYLLVLLLLTFFTSTLVAELAFLQPYTVFGLYDPVLIITDTSLTVKTFGVPILCLLALSSVVLIYLLSTRYHWVRVVEQGKLVTSSNSH